ncbi:MAG: FAD synthase [Candidatus Bathyarchaeota archaeon]|nr:MAG: FAD synthase [Candidatus Bathyarchaeota archaeon]
MTTVLTSGAFDLIHYGHIRLLEEAKRLGGPDARLVVIVARDETVRKLKGRMPVIPEDQRRAVVEALKMVDEALLGYEALDMASVIEAIKPDIIAVGHDQDDIEEMARKVVLLKSLDTRVVKMGKFGQSDLDSSSKIKRKIVEDLRSDY